MAEQEEMAMSEPNQTDHSAPESAEQLEPERDAYAAQADGESAPADNVSEETGDKASVDGRLSSLPPDYEGEELKDDPSAQEAEIQSGE
jgi:segregation and condensation protein B